MKVNVYHARNPSFVTIAINADYVWPDVVLGERACPRVDGWWGPHEYAILPQLYDSSSPYMAWIPSLDAYRSDDFARKTGLDPAIVLLDFDIFPLVPVANHFDSTSTPSSINPPRHPSLPNKPNKAGTGGIKTVGLNFCSASDAMRRIIKTQVDSLSNRVRSLIVELEKDASHSIRPPTQALFHLQQAYYWNLLPGTNTECGHYLILAGMKRAVMELHGFILWYHDYRHTLDHARPIIRRYQKWFRTRGALVANEADYAYLGKHDIPAWATISADEFKPSSSARAVPLLTIPTHREPMFPAAYKGGHHTVLFFYPPEVDEDSSFELSARGYAARRDTYHFNNDIAKVHEKMRNEQRMAVVTTIAKILILGALQRLPLDYTILCSRDQPIISFRCIRTITTTSNHLVRFHRWLRG